MRCYLLLANKENGEKERFSFDIKTSYAMRLIKDVGLYGVCYLLYDPREKQIIEKGNIHRIDYYEEEQKYQAFFEEQVVLKHALDIEMCENNTIIPLNMSEIKKMGVAI
ncbi:hypothetical protein [Cellulosilyticum sp. I15G10I2]|uniref:hypothetical protein n=1 Tax=Cellulosilyticum sp. I15G10I2 TaxID=1892843 RepID=UPI00085C1011|nr:hypothetical protein [Cellulosilyticum sp. I15G10I2]